MRERNYDELTVYKAKKNECDVDKETVLDLISQKGTAIVYIVDSCNKIIGIVTRGDVIRSTDNRIMINRNFVYVRRKNRFEANQIFLEYENIDKIPIINENNELIGDYSRFSEDNIYWNYVLNQTYVWKKTRNYLKFKHINKVNIVLPSPKKYQYLKDMTKIFDDLSITYDVIEVSQYLSCRESLIVFIDEDDRLAADCLACSKSEYNKNNEVESIYSLYYAVRNYEHLKYRNSYSIDKEGIEIPMGLRELIDKGVRILCLFNGSDDEIEGDEFWRSFAEESHKYKKQYNIKGMEFWPKNTKMYYMFFSDLLELDNYRNGTAQNAILTGHRIHADFGECNNGYYTVKQGERIVCNQPEIYSNIIYFFGQCMIMGAYVEDKYTIESLLQEEINISGFPYRIVNRGSYRNIYDELSRIDFQSGDIAILWSGSRCLEGLPGLDIKKIFRNNNAKPGMFLDCLAHSNHEANRFIAKAINTWIEKSDLEYKRKRKIGPINFKVNNYEDILGNYFKKIYIDRYFSDYERDDKKNCALIVWIGLSPKLISEVVKKIENNFDNLIVFIPESWRNKLYIYDTSEYISELYRLDETECKLKIISGEYFVPYEPLFWSFGENSRKCTYDEVKTHLNIFVNCVAKDVGINYLALFDIEGDDDLKNYNDWIEIEKQNYNIKTTRVKLEC